MDLNNKKMFYRKKNTGLNRVIIVMVYSEKWK